MPESLPHRTIVGEASFSRVLAAGTRDFQLSARRVLETPPEAWSERVLYALYQQATDLETLLDDHGAKRNAAFHGLREAVARVRWLALAGSAFAHLSARLGTYPSADPDALRADLGTHVTGLVERLGGMLLRATQVLVQEWVRTDTPWGSQTAEPRAAPAHRQSLAADRPLEEEFEETESRGARFVGRFVRLAAGWSEEARIPRRGLDELRDYMRQFCSETMARMMESHAHNVQSEYDTHLRGSLEEASHPGLAHLRSGVSQCFHLLEAVTALTHLYERHWLHEKDRAYRAEFETVMPLPEFLDLVVNGCIIRSHRCLQDLLPEAQELLGTLAAPRERRIRLPEGIQLHARPLSLIVAVVNHHKTPVQMLLGSGSANAASIMSLLILSGSSPQLHEVVFRGAEPVLDDLEVLFAAGLGERGLDQVPERIRRYFRS